MKKTLTGIFAFFMIAAALILRPVPIVSEEEALVEQGVVSAIYEGGEKDIVFLLENNTRRFYINRGLENGLTLEGLRQKLLGQSVTFKYPSYWTPLDWNNRIRHLSKVEYEEEVLFNELRN